METKLVYCFQTNGEKGFWLPVWKKAVDLVVWEALRHKKEIERELHEYGIGSIPRHVLSLRHWYGSFQRKSVYYALGIIIS